MLDMLAHLCRWISAAIMSTGSDKQTCETCAQALLVEQFSLKPPDSKCTHEFETCSRCWQQWLQVQVATKTFSQIQCAQCPNTLGQGETKALATEEVYQR